jgi:hypothetical protein
VRQATGKQPNRSPEDILAFAFYHSVNTKSTIINLAGAE